MNAITSPRSIEAAVTSRCNARCAYCYFQKNTGVVYRDLPAGAWSNFFDELGEARVMSVCFSGGEPFIREDLFEILDAVVRNRMRFEILSNGFFLDETTARRLKATGRCKAVQISLDGSCPEVHESFRGPGTFRPAVKAIRNLLGADVPVTVRATIHPSNIEDLPRLAAFLLEDIGLNGFSTNSVSCLGTSGKYGGAVFLDTRQRHQAMRILDELDRRYPGRISASSGPLAELKMFRLMENASRDREGPAESGRLIGCGCIFERIAVNADGAYLPCVMLPQMVLGHIGQDRMLDIWRDSPVLNSLRRRILIPLESFDECRDCPYLSRCTGSCAGTALSILGDPNRPSPEACLRRYKADLEKDGLPWPI